MAPHPFDTQIFGYVYKFPPAIRCKILKSTASLLPEDASRLRNANMMHYCLGCLSYNHKQYDCGKKPVCKTCGKEGHLATACPTAGITNERAGPTILDRPALPVRPSPAANDQQTTPCRPRGPPRIPSSSPEVPPSSPEVPLAVEALERREAALATEREAFEEEKRAFAEVKAAFDAEKEALAERVREVEGREAAIEARELEKELGELEEKRVALQARLKERKRKAGEAPGGPGGEGGKE